MVIGLDIDDTITDTFGVMFGYAQKYTIEELNKSGEIDYLTAYPNHNYIQTMHHWSRDEEENFFKKYFKEICEETEPFPFAVETINRLKEEGHKIVLITARWDFEDTNVRKITEEWVKKQNIHYDTLVVNAATKLEAAKENNVDVFIDDSFENCKAVASGGIKTFIMDTRCNKGLETPEIQRVFSWPHIEHEIRKEIK